MVNKIAKHRIQQICDSMIVNGITKNKKEVRIKMEEDLFDAVAEAMED